MCHVVLFMCTQLKIWYLWHNRNSFFGSDFIYKTIWNIDINSLAFLKSRVHSLAFSPNCHLHCVSASYSSPGSFSGYLYSCMALGSSDRQVAWAVLRQKHDCKTAWLQYSRDGHHDNITVVPLATFRDFSFQHSLWRMLFNAAIIIQADREALRVKDIKDHEKVFYIV